MKKIKIQASELFTMVDDENFDYLNQFNWFIDTRGYVYRNRISNGKTNNPIRMHREIMKPDKKLLVDHINHDTLDNRKINLRVCSSSQNNMNRKPVGSSGYKGVHYDKRSKKWRAHIKINKKQINLGAFSDKLIAAKIYNEAAKIYFGEFAYLNSV